jgi:mono/diheme cytochrome c family protein
MTREAQISTVDSILKETRKVRIIGTLVLALSLCPFAAWAGAAEGKATFEKSCRGCHGADGKGNPAIEKMMKVTLKPLGSKEIQAKSDADLKAVITKGSGKMKAVSSVKEDQVADVIAYIRTLQP